VYRETFTLITKEVLESIFRQFEIKNSIVSSVAGLDLQVIDFLKENSNFVYYSHKTKLPITLLYKNTETLGLDRIANAVGAAASYPAKNVLSIQAGTCLVLDFVNKKREYLGGSISPGIQMRFEALHQKTKNLPLLSATEKRTNYYGNDTNSSINCGVIKGICYEIEGFIKDYKAQYKDLIVLITGGDAVYLQNSIKNTLFAAQNLVLKGLNEIIKYNV
jgi:type III pantothenate kinase